MATQEINIELLLGKRVFSVNGRSIGRLEEVQAELRRGRCFVTAFHVGSHAILQRLAALHIGRAILHLVRGGKKNHGYRIAWEQLDFSDPKRLRLRCEVSELERLTDNENQLA